MSRRRQIVSATGIISGLTLLSRILGVVRDQIIAARLGASELNSIYQIAFQIPNLARRVLGEGALSAFIVPVITGIRSREGEKNAWRFAANAFNLFFIFTLLVTLIGLLFSKELFFLFGGSKYAVMDAASFQAVYRDLDPVARAVITSPRDLVRIGADATAIMFPYLMLLTLVALTMGLLHSVRHFTAPAAGSAVMNIVLIVLAVIWYRTGSVRFVYILSWSVLVSALVRLAILFPPLYRRGFRWSLFFNWRDPGFRELLSKMPGGLGITGVAIVNNAVMFTLANWAMSGAVVFITYSQRLVQLPMALFSTALSTAILPQLSTIMDEDNRVELRSTVTFAMRAVSTLSYASAFGLMALAQPIVEILFVRGQFTLLDARHTAYALALYAPSLVAFDLQKVLLQVYYSQKDMITPVKYGARAMVVNIVLSVLLVLTPLNYAGLALASSISQLFMAWSLWRGLTTRFGRDLGGNIGSVMLRALLCAALMGLVCWIGYHESARRLGVPGTMPKIVLLASWIVVGMAFYAAASRLAGLWDHAVLVRLLRRKRL
jgi:putative peptidoglycan lipid II flippase